MIVVGHKVRVIRECWWVNGEDCFALLGLEGDVYDVELMDGKVEVGVLFPTVGHTVLPAEELEIIE